MDENKFEFRPQKNSSRLVLDARTHTNSVHHNNTYDRRPTAGRLAQKHGEERGRCNTTQRRGAKVRHEKASKIKDRQAASSRVSSRPKTHQERMPCEPHPTHDQSHTPFTAMYKRKSHVTTPLRIRERHVAHVPPCTLHPPSCEFQWSHTGISQIARVAF